MVNQFNLKEHSKGLDMTFSPKGRLALMFLKHYSCCSDEKLKEQLNGNLEYHFFCDIALCNLRIENYKIICQIRCELVEHLDIDTTEQQLYKHYSSYMNHTNQVTVDATCYDGELRYPTDQKLLWEAVHWLYKQLCKTCKQLGIKMIRSRYLKWKRRYQGYNKMRDKTNKKRTSITRSLLKLLKKFIGFEQQLRSTNGISNTVRYYRRIATIKKIYTQQDKHFKTGEKIKDRIVSISKDYIRPIV